MTQHITEGSVFDDLGFTTEEAANLKIRATLMRAIESELTKQRLTQAQAATILEVSQPRVSDLLRGKLQLFTIDSLINMLAKLDKHVSIIIDNKIAA